ncbi:MAG TPA: P-II family nitrogen regulator [Streptosporangiaceae bacterium]|nr:P-II family nitrogen regulator [Streptosporangiaceae bacterium]
MKIVTAVVKLEKLDDVAHAVCEVGARGLTATEVRGFGRQYGHHGQVLAEDATVLVLPKLRIDVLTTDELAWPVADAIAKSVNTGTIGDGKIWISPVESALRVRTGERDLAAL